MKLSSDARELVQRRAQGLREYCRLPQDASILPHRVDHLIGKQHRGSDDSANLCLGCIRCNLKKGPNIASIDPETGLVVALYHLRRQIWREHLGVSSDGTVQGQTPEERSTVQLLDMNEDDRVRLRRLLLRRGLCS